MVLSTEGVVHEILANVNEVHMESAVTRCGWKFGRTAVRIIQSTEGVMYKRLCARCFPEAREKAKAALTERVRGAGLGEAV